VEARSDVEAPVYRWRRDGVPINDDGVRVRGAYSAVLAIDPTVPDDTGIYDVIVSDRCTTVTSHAAALSTCAIDWNRDARIDSRDFFDFMQDFFAGKADFNRSGSTDSSDFFAFVTVFLLGC
jgi:hypothetical protein